MNSFIKLRTIVEKSGIGATLQTSIFVASSALLVSSAKKQGKSLDEIVAAKPTAAFDAKWGNFVFNGDQFTKMVYAGLQPASAAHRE